MQVDEERERTVEMTKVSSLTNHNGIHTPSAIEGENRAQDPKYMLNIFTN